MSCEGATHPPTAENWSSDKKRNLFTGPEIGGKSRYKNIMASDPPPKGTGGLFLSICDGLVWSVAFLLAPVERFLLRGSSLGPLVGWGRPGAQMTPPPEPRGL